ncbi:hypothetical protein K1719_041665 [Acacia pycnantha]|nr:hypothetical protein K1719_041665 [Acacia pycnantha]
MAIDHFEQKAFWIFLCWSLCFSLTSAFLAPTFPSSAYRPQRRLADSVQNTGLYRTEFYTQILDHFDFNPQSYRTFQQRYLINDTYWGGASNKAPVFVYSGNEGDIEWFAQNTGFMFETAPHFKALLVFIEHRFYGNSTPFEGDREVLFGNSSKVGYLTSTQALADYATLIIDLKKNLSATDSPVIVFGGSYGGMLAAWFRMNHTRLQERERELLQSDKRFVGRDTRGGPKTRRARNAGQILQNMRESERLGCFDRLAAWGMDIHGHDGLSHSSNFLSPLPAYPVKKMCEAIDNAASGKDTFAKLYAAANIFYNYSGIVTCFDLEDNSDPHGLAGWQWQACTEMIMPQGASREDGIFPVYEWKYEDRVAYCSAKYGVEPRPHWITAEFGGPGIERVLKRSGGNIIFFNGLRDPWSGGGVLKNISQSLVAIVAKQGAHHVDLRFSDKEDPQWLKDVRKQEVDIISSWISQYYQDLAP